MYRELEDAVKTGVLYHSVQSHGPLHAVPVNAQYKSLSILDQKRLVARKSSTTYCYDFPLVMFTISSY